MIPHMSLIDILKNITHTVQLTKKKNSYIYFITMVCAVLSLSSFLFSLIMHFQLELVSQELTHLRSIPLVLQNP